MRRLSTRRRRSATVCSRRAQSRTARSIASSPSLEAASADSAPQLRPGVPALALDALDHLIDARALPRVEHLVEQRPPVVEVPVEAALGDAERLRQRLDPDGVRAAGSQGPQPLIDPRAARRAGERPSSISIAFRAELTSPQMMPKLQSIRYRMDGGPRMRLPNTAHTSRPWRIHELTRDFRLEDVWALPTPGGPDDFPRLVQAMASGDPAQGSSRVARALFAIRWKVGELLGWDGPDAGLGSRVPTLRDRLPADLRDAPSGPSFDALPFTSLYLLDDEWAAEIANRTVHGVMHVGWVPDGTGGYRGQMAVLVKPNGLLGIAYMAAIRPFRHLTRVPADDATDRAGLAGAAPAIPHQRTRSRLLGEARVPTMNRGVAIRLCDETFSSATETDSPHSPTGSRRSALSTIAIHHGLARRHRRPTAACSLLPIGQPAFDANWSA